MYVSLVPSERRLALGNWAAGLILMIAGCERGPSPIDAVIVGDSMAPAFHGEHLVARCEECDARSMFSAARNAEFLVCPNCGFRKLESGLAAWMPAERVFVNAVDSKHLKRWDVVAVADKSNGSVIVKRIVGLLNETLSFHDGEIFVNDQLERKPLDICRKMRVPVFDSVASADVLVKRLRPQLDSDSTNWTATGSFPALVWQPRTEAKNHLARDWLVWHQWRCVEHDGPVDQDFPIEDYYSQNQHLARNLHAMDDLWLAVEVKMVPGSVFAIQWSCGDVSHDFAFDLTAGIVWYDCSNDGENLQMFPVKSLSHQQIYNLELITFDRQLRFLVNGNPCVSIDLDVERTGDVATHPLKLSATGGRVELRRFQLWRDIYYYDVVEDRQKSGMAPLRATAEEFLLVGDNVPVSIDSRHWPRPGVAASQILGRVVQAGADLAQSGNVPK